MQAKLYIRYMLNPAELKDRIEELTGWMTPGRVRVIADTSDPMRIYRGNVMRLGGRDFLVKGNMREPRFGIDDQMKYWVFKAIDLETNQEKIIKTEFDEEFFAHIGILKIRCYRSPDKEANILDLIRGNDCFMQGYRVYDDKKNNVRIIDFIRGKSFFHYIPAIEKSHYDYFREDLPEILRKLLGCMRSIGLLHTYGTSHGDIRNDHIIIENDTGKYRWIDFDLKQDIPDFDLWSIGNLINYAVAKGIITFKAVLSGDEFSDEVKKSLVPEDGSAFYEYRIMNLWKLFPYIPDRLRRLMQNFTLRPKTFYKGLRHLINEYTEMLEIDFPRS